MLLFHVHIIILVDGSIKSMVLTLHLEGDFKSTEYKLSWLADDPSNLPVEMYEFDHLITEREVNKETDVDSIVRERTEYVLKGSYLYKFTYM